MVIRNIREGRKGRAMGMEKSQRNGKKGRRETCAIFSRELKLLDMEAEGFISCSAVVLAS